MGTITTGVGLISGINTANLIDQLIAIEARGKTALENRLALIQGQRTAMLDINARLLNLKGSARGLRLDKVFQSALATSSNPEVLTATANGSVQPGTYGFRVKQVVSNSQKVTRGFADGGSTPAGLTSLSFELGNGFLARDTDLTELNAGAGAARGKIKITDSVGNISTIDLSTATTLDDVLEAINNDDTVSVTASVEGDHLVVTDTAGGAGTLTIANAAGYTTASDLGIAGTGAGPNPVITGTDIRTLGGATRLSTLNDGTGILIRDANPDIRITARNGDIFDIDFGRVDNDITGTTLIEDLNDGDGVAVNEDSTEDIQFIARDGTEHLVDLTGIETVQDFMDRVFDQTDGDITITITGGDQFTVTDNTAGAGKLKVLGAGPNGTETAEALGILNEAGVSAPSFNGEVLENADHTPAAATLQDIIDRINNAKDTLLADNGGRIAASIAPDGLRLRITDTTGGAGNLKIEDTVTNPYAARDLGIEADVAAATVDGSRLIGGLNSVLVASLNGGTGLGGNNSLTITDRDGVSDTFTLDEGGSLSEIVDLINASAIEVTASLNDAANGLLITDTSGGPSNLIVTGNAAAELGIGTGAPGVPSSTVRGTDLELRYVAEGTALSALNYGRGTGTGSFRITDGEGHQFTVTLGSSSRSVYDVIAAINSAADPDAKVAARINDTGDGILLENTLVPPAGLIKVESLSGTVAANLNIVGQATTDGGSIDGSYERTITLNASDTLDEIVEAINDEGIPIAASIINSGGGPTPIQLVFSAEIAGIAGDLLIDDGGFGLDLVTLTEARDARVLFGSGDPATATLIQRNSNSIANVLPGVTMTLLSASEDPVTLTINRDTAAIEERIAGFVAAFNDAVGRIDQYDFFDVDTEKRGPLLGNPTTGRVRAALFRTLQQRATGMDTQYKYLSQVGITVASGGEAIAFNSEKFRTAYGTDPEAVENLFTAFQGTSNTSEEIAEGVTVTTTGQTHTVLGFGDLFDQLLDGITNSIDGSVTLADETFQGQIDLTNSRIEAFDDRLAAKRARLEQQFAAMESALAKLTSQQNAILSLAGNLALSQQSLLG